MQHHNKGTDAVFGKDGLWTDADRRSLDLLRNLGLAKAIKGDEDAMGLGRRKCKPTAALFLRIEAIIASEKKTTVAESAPIDHEQSVDVSMEDLWGVQDVPPQDIMLLVRRAYMEIRRDWATDRVVADPELNDLFLRRCWEIGAQASAYDLNRALFNARKSGKLSGLAPAKRFTIPRRELDTFSYACEFVVRHLQEREFSRFERLVSIDTLLCDPGLRGEFDLMASELVPERTRLELRWAILQMRKRGRSNVRPPKKAAYQNMGKLSTLRIQDLTTEPGLYWLHGEGKELFFGQAENLRVHIGGMLERSGMKVIPEWFGANAVALPQVAVCPTPHQNFSARENVVLESSESWETCLNFLKVKQIEAA